GDPADRIIYATAVENGWQLVTKDDRLRDHRHPRQITLW
ncbi:MAG: PIN domain-containing protein, partial [Nitrososphaerales archaeon]